MLYHVIVVGDVEDEETKQYKNPGIDGRFHACQELWQGFSTADAGLAT